MILQLLHWDLTTAASVETRPGLVPQMDVVDAPIIYDSSRFLGAKEQIITLRHQYDRLIGPVWAVWYEVSLCFVTVTPSAQNLVKKLETQ